MSQRTHRRGNPNPLSPRLEGTIPLDMWNTHWRERHDMRRDQASPRRTTIEEEDRATIRTPPSTQQHTLLPTSHGDATKVVTTQCAAAAQSQGLKDFTRAWWKDGAGEMNLDITSKGGFS